MPKLSERPSLKEFLCAPVEQVRAVAPQTMIYAPGGTRRQAELAGISFQSEDYPAWSRQRMVETIAALAHVGVRHIVMNLFRPSQLAEVGRYRERLLAWLEAGLASEQAIAVWQARGWRMRMLGVETLPELQPAAARLVAETTPAAELTVWWYLCATPETPWAMLGQAAELAGRLGQRAAIEALYGEPIEPASLYIAFGKPIIAFDIIPPLLAGEMQCYWTQRPGFNLDEPTLRHILYDCAYLRPTWQQDKSIRYADLPQQRAHWQQPRVLGLGERVGAFWYPLSDDRIGSQEQKHEPDQP